MANGTRFVGWGFRVLPAVIFLELILVYGYFFRAESYLGERPLPYTPDPKSLPFTIHFGLLAYGFFLCIATIAFQLILQLLAARLKIEKEKRYWWLSMWSLTFAFFVSTIAFDPDLVWEWIFD